MKLVNLKLKCRSSKLNFSNSALEPELCLSKLIDDRARGSRRAATRPGERAPDTVARTTEHFAPGEIVKERIENRHGQQR